MSHSTGQVARKSLALRCDVHVLPKTVPHTGEVGAILGLYCVLGTVLLLLISFHVFLPIGPKSSHIRLFGDKLRARTLAHRCNVPVLPPTPPPPRAAAAGEEERPLRSFDEVNAVVDRIGLPVVVKAVHGGGGKGIR